MNPPRKLFELRWDNYPRAQFFKDRYLSLLPRFKRVIAALSRGFDDDTDLMKDLDDVYEDLKQNPKVLVIGDHKLTLHDLVMVETAEETQESTTPNQRDPDTIQDTNYNSVVKVKVETNKNSTVQVISVPDNSNISSTSTSETHSYINPKSGSSQGQPVEVNDRIKDMKQIETTTYAFLDERDVCLSLPNLDIDMLKFSEVPCKTLIDPQHEELAGHISDILEWRIVYRFVKIFSHMKQFIVIHRRYDLDGVTIVATKEIKDVITNILSVQCILTHKITESNPNDKLGTTDKVDGHTKTQNVIHDICSSITNKAVDLFASKYNLHISTCRKVLTAAQFEKNLVSTLTTGTEETLIRYVNCWNKSDVRNGVYNGKTRLERTSQHILKDIEVEFNKTEIILSRIETVMTVMRKMAFEIRGNLRQTKLIDDFDDKMFQYKPISPTVKDKILRVKGVFSVATVYGELEVCLEPETFGDSSSEVQTILKQHSYPYKLKQNTSKLQLLVKTDNVIESGGEIFCGNRIGTLGACLRGSDNQLYGITCAHVVEGLADDVQVFYNLGGTRRDFGSVKACVVQHLDHTNIRTVDIAAITIHDACQKDCRYKLYDGLMNFKSILYANDYHETLVGTTVYKYGAKTSFTEGNISTVDNLITNENANKIFINIEPLPDVEDSTGRDSGIYISRESTMEGHANDQTKGATNVSENTDRASACDSAFSESMEIAKQEEDSSAETDTSGVNPNENEEFEDHSSHLSMPELGEEDSPRNSEAIGNRVSEARLDSSQIKKFADEGDSGAFVCMTNVKRNSILVVSMISAGDISNNNVCLSLPIGDQLHALVKRMSRGNPGFYFKTPISE